MFYYLRHKSSGAIYIYIYHLFVAMLHMVVWTLVIIGLGYGCSAVQCQGIGEFPAQMASNAENVSI